MGSLGSHTTASYMLIRSPVNCRQHYGLYRVLPVLGLVPGAALGAVYHVHGNFFAFDGREGMEKNAFFTACFVHQGLIDLEGF